MARFIPPDALRLLDEDIRSGRTNYDELNDDWKGRLDAVGYTPPPPPAVSAPSLPGIGMPSGFDPEISDPSLQWKATPPAEPEVYSPEGGYIGPMSTGGSNLWEKGDLGRAAFQGLQVPYNLGFRGGPETDFVVEDTPAQTFTPEDMRQYQASMEPQSPLGKLLGFGAEQTALAPFYAVAGQAVGAPLAGAVGKGLGALGKAAPKAAPAIEKIIPYAKTFASGFGMGAPVETALGLGEGEPLPQALGRGAQAGALFGGFNVAARGAKNALNYLRRPKMAGIAERVVEESKDLAEGGPQGGPGLLGRLAPEVKAGPLPEGIKTEPYKFVTPTEPTIKHGNHVYTMRDLDYYEKQVDDEIVKAISKANDIPIDEREFSQVGSKKINAYQYDHPELKPYVQAEANRLLGELKSSVKGERFSTIDEGGQRIWQGVPRTTSEPIARILDATKAKYADVEKALQRIINNEGAENQALAKRIELIVDDNLTDGSATLEGIKISPNKEYVTAKNAILDNTELKELHVAKTNLQKLKTLLAKKTEPLPEGVGAQKFTIPGKMAPVGDGTKIRSLGVTAMGNPELHPDVKAGLLMETYEGGAGTYEGITNKATIAKAQELIASNLKGAERFAKSNPGTALSNTIHLELVKKANLEGRFDDAIDLIQEVSQRSTTQGQAIQSLRMWGKLSTEGMQKFYVDTVDKVNKSIVNAAKKVKVSDDIMSQIKTSMDKIGGMADGRDKDIAIAQTLDLIASQVPVPFLRKVASIQTMAQLLNPKTAIRNIVGNVGFAGLENVSSVVGAAIDKPLSFLTGQRTKVLPSLGAQAKGFKQGWKHGLEDALLGIDTSGMATKFDLPRGRVFRSGPLGFAEKALNIELRATDRAFYQAAYEDSLLNQMRAAKMNTPTEEMRNVAHLDGLYRTFQDDNALSNLFTGIKRLLNANKEFGVGDFIIKYPRTPANLLARGLDYSPTGFVKTILEASKPLAKQQFNQKAFVESFSRATVGSTSLFGVGALLHKLGVITGGPPEDRDLAELQRQQGFGEYRLNTSALKRLVFGGGTTKPQKGDKIVSYDWFQPQAIPLAIGADIDANKGTGRGIAGTLMDALTTGINAFAEQPVVQGIQTLFSGGYGDWSKGVVKVLETVPSSFVPTLLSQVRQLVDNQRRETYSPDKGQEALNRVAAKVPGLAGKLPVKYGTLGQPLETYQGGGNNPFNVFLNPAFVNTYGPSPEVQRVFDLYSQTGETKQVPRVVDKSITVSGQKFVLSGKEYSEYQRLLGEYTQQGFAKMSGNSKPEDAVKKMQDIMTDANTKAKTEILKAKGQRVYKKGSGIAVK